MLTLLFQFTKAGNADGQVYEKMLKKAQDDEELNVGSKADQQRLYVSNNFGE